MTFLTDLQNETAHAIKVAVLMEGVGIFSEVALPSVWDSSGECVFNSESYPWYERLYVHDGFGQLGMKYNPLSGKVVSSVSSVTLRLPGTNIDDSDDVVISLLSRDPDRSDVFETSLRDNFDIGDTTCPVTTVSGWPSSGAFHAGNERVTYTSTTGGATPTFNGCTRGTLGSPELYHRGIVQGTTTVGNGAIVRSEPLSFADRLLWVFYMMGTDTDSGWVPKGAAFGDSDSWNIARGLIVDREPDGNNMLVEWEVAGLEQLMARKMLSRQPKARAGLFALQLDQPGGIDRIQIGPTRNTITWANTGPGGASDFYTQPKQLLQSDGMGGSQNVPDGTYFVYNVARWIAFTMNAALNAKYGSDYIDKVEIDFVDVDGDRRVQIAISTSIASTAVWFQILQAGPKGSVWRSLGITGDKYLDIDNGATAKEFVFTSDRDLPVLDIPPPTADAAKVSRIYYDAAGILNGDDEDFDGAPGWKDSDGNDMEGHAIVAGVVFSFNTVSAGSNPFGERYLAITGQELLGSRLPDEGIYIESNPDPGEIDYEEVSQMFCITNSYLEDAFNYAIHSGSGTSGHNHATYDRGWRGSGLNIRSVHTSSDAFKRSASSSRIRWDAVWASKPIAMREWFKGERALMNLSVTAFNDPEDTSAGYVIQPIRIRDALLHELGEAIELGLNEVSIGPTKDSDSDSNMMNRLTVDTYWNVGKDEARRKDVPIVHATFADSYGPSPRPASIEIRGMINSPDFLSLLLDYVQLFFAQNGPPRQRTEVPIATPYSWVFKPGDTLKITHPSLINRVSASRGWTLRPSLLLSRDSIFKGDGPVAFSRVEVVPHREDRRVAIAPSADVVSIHGAPSTVYNVTAQKYRSADRGVKDIEDFRTSEYALCFQPHDWSTAVERQITAIDVANSRVTLASAPPFSPPFRICFPDSDSANITARQLSYAIICDGDAGTFDLSSGTDTCHRYT